MDQVLVVVVVALAVVMEVVGHLESQKIIQKICQMWNENMVCQ